MDCHSVPTFSCKHVEGYMAKSRKVLTFHEYMQNMAKSASPKKRSRIKKQENPPITPTPTLTPYAQATRTLGRNAGTGPMTAAQIGATSTPVTNSRIWIPTDTAEPEYTATPEPSPTYDVTNTPSPTITPTPVSTDYPDAYTDLRNVLVGTPMPKFGEKYPRPAQSIEDFMTNPIRQTAVKGVTNQDLASLAPTTRSLYPTSTVYIPPETRGITNQSTKSLTVDESKELAENVIRQAGNARLMFGQNTAFDPENIGLTDEDYSRRMTTDTKGNPVYPPTLSDLLQMPLNDTNRQMFRERFGRDTFNADDLNVIQNYLITLNNASKSGAIKASDTSTQAQDELKEVGNTVASDPEAQNDFWSKFFGATDERLKPKATAQSDTKDFIQPMVSGYYDFMRFNDMNTKTSNLLNTVRGYIDKTKLEGDRLPYDYNIDRKIIEEEYPVVSKEVAQVLGTAQAKKPPKPAYLDPTQVSVLYGANEYGIGDKRETGYDEERDRDWIDVTAPDYVKYRVFTGDPNQPSVAISHPGLTATARKLTGTPTPEPTLSPTPKVKGAVTGARQTATAQAEKDFVTEARNTLASFANDGTGADNAFDAISVLRQYRPNSVTIDKYGNASYTDPVTKQVIIVDSDGLVTRNTIPQATGTAQALNSMYATPTATSAPTATTTPTATQSPDEDMAAYDAEKQKLIEDIDTYVKQEKTNTKGFFQRLNALAQMGALKDDAQYGKYLESPSGRVYFGADVNEYLNNNYVLDQSTRPFAVTNPTLTALAGQPPDTASSDSFLPAIGSPLDVAEDEKPLYTPPQALGYVPANWRTDAEIANTYNEPAYVTQRPSYNPTPTPGTGTNTQQGGGNWFQNAWNWVTGNDEQGMIAPKKVYAADRNTATPSVGTATTTRTPTFTATKTTTPTPTQTATTVPAKQTSPQITPTITATQTGAQLQDMQRQRAQQQAQAVLSQSQNKAVSRWSAPNGAMQAAQAQAQQPAPNGAMQAAQAQQQIQPKPTTPAVPPFDPSKMGYTAPTATVQYGTYKPASSATTGAAGTAGTPATSTTTQPAVTAPSVATQTVGTKGSAKLARDKKKHGKLKKDISVGTGLTAHATQPVKESPMPKIKTSYGRYKYPKSSPSSTKYGVTNDTFRKQMNVMYPRQEMANVMPMPPAREHNRVQQMPMSYESPQYVRKMAGSEGMNDMQFTAPSLPKMPEQKRDVQKYTSANLNKYEKRGK